ncbi:MULTISPECIES: hypothetical protein [unclassified Thioalkalivibrio]|uniref:hypothetical protein n=1 Tax=unclassified Thioalkalivibrio TaxID=2621013 RepID=UPI00036A9CF2|nr:MULTISPECIES: hypothetical protein [unclassified Thioalkalivibrio]
MKTAGWTLPILIIGLAGLLSGCAPTTLKAPAAPEDPVIVAVLDHGRHSSLVIPSDPPGHWLRYSYGDWSFYVERETGPGAMLAAVFASTPAALGRQELEGVNLNAAVRGGLRVPLEDIHHIEVPATRARALVEKLEAIWEDGADERVDSDTWGMSFVGHPDAYTLRHNSNRVVAQWLESLDVEVSRKPILSNWRVEVP